MGTEPTFSRPGLHRGIYPFRVVGLTLGAAPVAVVLHLHDAPVGAWIFLAVTALLWPHLAYFIASRSSNPNRVEGISLLVDSAIVGAWVPMMHFNLLPTTLLLALSLVDKISTGVRGLLVRSLPGMVSAGAISTFAAGGQFDPVTTTPVILACLPVMLIHSIAVSLGSHRLIRRIGQQNRELDRLHRTDALTGLSARAHWEQHAAALLQEVGASGATASLLVIDVDEFKQVNDRHGHAAGDEVLRSIATRIRTSLRPRDCAGRIGGDEFVVLLPATTAAQAESVADRVRCAVEEIRLRDYPDVHPTISVGLAASHEAIAGVHDSLRAWLNAADRALYRAKDAGRNRVHA